MKPLILLALLLTLASAALIAEARGKQALADWCGILAFVEAVFGLLLLP